MKKHILLLLIVSILSSGFSQTNKNQIEIEGLAWGEIINNDFNLDGKNDLFICGRNSQKQAVSQLYFNQNGQFIKFASPIEGMLLSAGISADFDKDGYPDILLTGKNNKGEIKTLLYKNINGTGFSEQICNIANVFNGAVAIADYDGDNDFDILITGRTSNSIVSKVYKNNGNFNFTEAEINLVPVYNSAALWTDLNNDSLPDIVISGEDGLNRYTKVYQNMGNGEFEERSTALSQLSNGAI